MKETNFFYEEVTYQPHAIITFKRCLPRGGCKVPYVVGKGVSAEEISNNFSKSPIMSCHNIRNTYIHSQKTTHNNYIL